MERDIYSNIYKLYIIKIAKWFMLVMPVIALFYNHYGLNDFQMLVVQGTYSFSIVVFEIPSGYIADLWGRKNTLVFGTICGAVGYLIYSFTSTFWGFLIAELILGIGESFVSGADSAMLYDSLAHLRSTKKYLKFEGQITAVGSFSETIASSIGGSLAIATGLRAPFIAQAIVAAIGIPAAMTLLEPDRKMISEKASMRHVFTIFRKSLFQDMRLSSALILSSIAGCATLTMAWTAQLLFVHHHLSEGHTTLIWVSLNFCVALISLFAAHINGILGSRTVFWAIIIALPCAYLTIPLQYSFGVILGILFIFYIIRGLATPILKEQVNTRCSSDVRATVLSIRSLLIRLIFSLAGPAIGWIAVLRNFNYALLSYGVILAIALSCSALFFIQYDKIETVQ